MIVDNILLSYKHKGRTIKFKFPYNPNTLTVTTNLVSIESSYLRQNGIVIRPSKIGSRILTGNGTFLDDGEKKGGFNTFKRLENIQSKLVPVKFFHSAYRNMNVIIEELSMTNSPRDNGIDFSFKFAETALDTTEFGFSKTNKTIPIPASSSPSNKPVPKEESSDDRYFLYTTSKIDTLASIAKLFYGVVSEGRVFYVDYIKSENPILNDVLKNEAGFLPPGLALKILKKEFIPPEPSIPSIIPLRFKGKSMLEVTLNNLADLKIFTNIDPVVKAQEYFLGVYRNGIKSFKTGKDSLQKK